MYFMTMPDMLLTIFYVAATWIQSRKLSALKKKIIQFASSHTSIVFYKIRENQNNLEEDIPNITISSSFCKNNDRAVVGEVLHFAPNTRSCVLMPQQIINVDNWITYTDETFFPFVNTKKKKKAHLKNHRLFLLIEATCLENSHLTDSHICCINQIGIPRAWRADDNLGLIIESDSDLLTKISNSFLSFPVFVDAGFEISRIQTVGVEGKPCLLTSENKNISKSQSVESQICSYTSSASGEWAKELSLIPSPNQCKSQMELLRSFSQYATLTAKESPVLIPEHQSTSIVVGNKVLKLDSPTIVDIPENQILESLLKKENKLESEYSPKSTSEIRIKSSSQTVLTSENTPRNSCDSSTVVSAQSTPSKHDFQLRKDTFSSLYSLGSASTLSIRSVGSGKAKPPNVLIYTESPTTTENIKGILNEILHRHKYTIYSISASKLINTVWTTNCFLLVICGNIPPEVESILIFYLVQGGRLLCLCSNFLHTLLPTFRTAEVRERELVHFTYGRWRRVRLMHHVFCYQNSPSRIKFSGDSDESNNEKDRISPVPQTPSSVEVVDSNGVFHTLHIQVLGVEETWQTPSLLLASFASPGGRAVFSQVHLELDPSQVLEEEEEALRNSEMSRKEILKDILTTHLGLEIGSGSVASTYTVAYFLGKHEAKLNFLADVKHLLNDGILKLDKVGLKFCGKGETLPSATSSLLPILVHSCPKDFSTVEYFENLKTKFLGRLVIYSEVMGSSMDVVNGDLAHGLAVVPSQQTSGRTSNQWLSPPGCAMFSLQIHFPSDSYMGSHPSILQHVVSVAILSSLAEMSPDYKKAFDLHLKWPNDIYTSRTVKIGGLIATCNISKLNVICNVGCGINLDNELPTTCLNKLIEDYNKANNLKLKKLSREKLLANIFTHLEKLLEKIDKGNIQYVEELYYKYWLHGGAEVTVLTPSGAIKKVIIQGIDEFGFLVVRDQSGETFTVHPDGNSFDMMEGLIAPRIN